VEPLVVFVHIPKTAGTTLGRILMRHYGREHVRRVANGARDPAACRADIAEIVRAADPRIRAIRGHIPMDACAPLGDDATYVTMLRDPVERSLSQYFHLFAKRPRDLPLERYVAEGHLVDNRQVRMLAGAHPPPGATTEAMLDAALENLERFAVVGLSERFDESVALVGEALGIDDTSYEPARVNEQRPPREAVSPAALALVEERNALDRRLYEHAAARLASRR
jgi:Sulfotransferase family